MLTLFLSHKLKCHILSYLDEDKDLNNFISVCKEARDFINEPNMGVWRTHARLNFDLPPQMTGQHYKDLYQYRRSVLNKVPHFELGRKVAEKTFLKVIRDLMVGKKSLISYYYLLTPTILLSYREDIATGQKLLEDNSLYSSSFLEPTINHGDLNFQISNNN